MSKLSSLDTEAFAFCANLEMINLPSSLTFIGEYCFNGCAHLHTVTFCPGSELAGISDHAFDDCQLLQSIILPSGVKTLGRSCFYNCSKLVNSPLAADSEVVRIGGFGFAGCSSLKSLVLPSSTEFVGEGCFVGCDSLSGFTLSSPSHLLELLDLPPQLPGFLAIPDSVQVLSYSRGWKRPPERTLSFGCESRLATITAKSGIPPRPCRSFLQVSSRSLKLFRKNLEFDTVIEVRS
jgi:hypothetical protein